MVSIGIDMHKISWRVILVEIQDITRFKTADELAAYLGLTPSQYSSGEHIRMGHISKRQPKIDPLRQPNFDPSMI